MNVISHGVDLVHFPRIERVWKDHGDLFLQRVFTPAEQAYCLRHRHPVVRLAGRFAAKEAVLKTLGTGWRGGILWTDIEILPDDLGKPHVSLGGKTSELAQRLKIGSVLISITHAGEYAYASAVGVADAPA